MKLLPIALFALMGLNLNAQFYYNDIISNMLSNQQYDLFKQNRIKKVTVSSTNADGTASEGFQLQQEFDMYWRKLTITSSLITGNSSVQTISYENNKVKNTEEINKGVQQKTEYTYDEAGKLLSVSSSFKDTALPYQNTEQHIWKYNTTNQPGQMLKIKNGKDTTVVAFMYDDKGNVAEERWSHKGLLLEIYYYYYNDKKQLTDIVRFNQKVKKMLPDFLFDYDANGVLTAYTQIPTGANNYHTWQYTYNAQGLKQEEVCYNKQKEVVGRISYRYE
jgi:YD repeat-containing protein